MQNDTLKNRIVPWQEKGRWYHGVADASNGTFDSNKTDAYLLNNAVTYENSNILYIYLSDKQIIDCKYLLNVTPIAASIMATSRINSAGVVSYVIGPKGTGTIEFWVFVRD